MGELLSAIIYTYEIELKVVDQGKTSLVTHTEYAYTLLEATQQALIRQMAVTPTANATLTKIGPPEDAIRAATSALQQKVTDTVGKLLGHLDNLTEKQVANAIKPSKSSSKGRFDIERENNA